MTNEREKWDCPTCGDEFDGKMGLSVHHSKKHKKPITHFGLDIDQVGPAIQCPTCDDAFFTKRAVNIHHKKVHDESIGGVEIECHQCGQSIVRRRARVDRAERPFCSKECCDEWRNGSITGEDHPSFDGGKDVFQCDYCSNKFEKYSSKIEDTQNVFCSNDCKDQYKSENLVGRDSPNWQRVEFDCDNCGDTVWVYPKDVHYDKHFCDNSCFVQWKRKSAPDIEKHSVKHGSFWKSQRKRALKRDDYECQSCGIEDKKHREKYGESLHVHHRTPARLFKSSNEAHKIENLTTLCASCHIEEEWNLRQRQNTTGRQSTLTEVFSQ